MSSQTDGPPDGRLTRSLNVNDAPKGRLGVNGFPHFPPVSADIGERVIAEAVTPAAGPLLPGCDRPQTELLRQG